MKKVLNVEIGARVRCARERLHLTREALAELLNISTLFLGYIECGQKGMSIDTLISLCETLNVSADYLLMGKAPASADSGLAGLLLQDLPREYLPLADESMRTLVKTIATVRAKQRQEADSAPAADTRAEQSGEGERAAAPPSDRKPSRRKRR